MTDKSHFKKIFFHKVIIKHIILGEKWQSDPGE